MGQLLTFPKPALAPVEPAPAIFDRALYRAGIEAAAQACLDIAHRLVELLDVFDGDPDFEPDVDSEDNGDGEPMLAAAIGAISQIRWVGFDQGEPA